MSGEPKVSRCTAYLKASSAQTRASRKDAQARERRSGLKSGWIISIENGKM